MVQSRQDKSIASKSSFLTYSERPWGAEHYFYMINSMLENRAALKLNTLEEPAVRAEIIPYHSGLPCADDD